MTFIRFSTALIAISLAPVAGANWFGTSEIGFVSASGNTDTDTANAKFDIARELEKWKHAFGIAGLYSESSEITTAQRWDSRWQTDYNMSERLFSFAALRYEDDAFSGFDYQGTLSAGVGRHFIDSEQTKLTAQIGAGYRSLRPETLVRNALEEVIERIPGERSEDAVFSGRGKLEHAFNDSTKLIDSVLIESGSDNTLAQNEIALQVKMTEVLALAVGFTVRNNSNPPPGLEETDTLTTINLVYEMK